MKIKIALLIFLVILAGCASQDSSLAELSNIEALKSTSPSKINSIRLASLQQTARELGAQAGLAWRSRQLTFMLNKQKRNLDQVFNFNYLMLNHNVLPPILDEARNTLNLADTYTIRASDQDYRIIAPPRFVTAPPSWRDYVWMNYKKPEPPVRALLPQNSDERQIWNEYVHKGWNEGITQADAIFSANLNRLERDYKGMILYRKLLAQNMVSAPFVSQSALGVTGGGNDMHINDRVLRITAIPQLQLNAKKWQPVITNDGKGNTDSSISLSPVTAQDKI